MKYIPETRHLFRCASDLGTHIIKKPRIPGTRVSGVARISGQGGPKKIRGGTSNKMKTEKKKAKYVHIGAPN
jgi:hypothetical protein